MVDPAPHAEGAQSTSPAAVDAFGKDASSLSEMAEVELKGREHLKISAWTNFWVATTAAVVVAGTLLLLSADRPAWYDAKYVAMVVGVLLLLAVAVVRERAYRITQSSLEPNRPGGAAEDPTPQARADAPVQNRVPDSRAGQDLVICCSGGGIKSASFCLGALQALDQVGLYGRSDSLIGVSGGGYAAAAFATARRGSRKPFAPGSPELAKLRRRTNYLASSPRARFEFFSSLLAGIVINLLIWLSITAVYAWFLAGVARNIGVGVADGGGRPTGAPWGWGDGDRWLVLLLPSGVLLLLSVAMFVWDRARADGRWQPLWGSRLPVSPWTDAPLAVLRAGVAWLLLVPGMLLLAIAAHNIWLQHAEISLEIQAFLSGTLGLMFLGLLSSTIKGFRGQTDRSTFGGNLLAMFRELVAAKLAIAVAAIFVVVGGATAVAYAMSDGDGGHPSTHWWTNPLIYIGILVATMLVITANSSSMYIYYRDRLAYAYLDYGTGSQDNASSFTFEQLEQDSQTVAGPEGSKVPELVLCGTANVSDGDILPTGREGTPFVFSNRLTGFTDQQLPGHGPRLGCRQYNDRTGYSPTVAQAVAVSGAAVAPVAGRETRMRRYRILLTLANIRLGVWLPNPAWNRLNSAEKGQMTLRLDRWLSRPSGLQVLEEAFATISYYSPWLYVTDGGHFDNLGLVEALRRRPKDIIMLDGSGDAEDMFPTMGRAIATARMDLNLEVKFDPRAMMTRSQPGLPGKGAPRAAWTTATARWLNQDGQDVGQTRIHYIKCVMPVGVSWDLQAYQRQHPEFPATSNSLEMYNEFEFEAFRQLGYAVVVRAQLENAFPSAPATLGTRLSKDLVEKLATAPNGADHHS